MTRKASKRGNRNVASPLGRTPKFIVEGSLVKVSGGVAREVWKYTRRLKLRLLCAMQEGHYNKTWKTRWFVLTDQELLYFKSPTDQVSWWSAVHFRDWFPTHSRPAQVALGIVVLRGYSRCAKTDNPSRPNSFALFPVQESDRVYYLSGST